MSRPEDEIQQAVQQAAAGIDQPIEVKLATGQVYRGRNHEEVLNAVVRAQEEATATIRDRERQIRELQQQQGAAAPVTLPANHQAGGFDAAHYYETLASNPIAAMDYLDAYRYGIAPESVQPVMQETIRTSRDVRDNIAIRDFQINNPDWPGGKESSDMLLEAIQREGRPMSADDLELVYRRLVREGRLQPGSPHPGRQETTRGAAAPPNVSGSEQGQGVDWMAELDSLPADKIRAIMARLGGRVE